MRHGSLFSGIGGFDLAAEWTGWENVFHCEWNEFGQKVLKYYWPNAISYHDITKTDFSVHRRQIDILTGGFPCQPYSAAGKRLGKEDKRHLWPEMLRAIREIQPTWVVGENVLGLVNWNGGLVFHEVQTDLEAEGYEVQPYVLPAVSVNAPHRRDRVWFVAYSDRNSRGSTESNINEEGQHIQCRSSRSCLQRTSTDTASDGLNDQSTERHNSIRQDNQQSGTQWECASEGLSNEWNAPDTTVQGLEGSAGTRLQGRIGRSSDQANERNPSDTESQGSRQQPSEDRGWQDRRFDNDGEVQYASDTDGIGLRRESDRTGKSGFPSQDGKRSNWSNFPTVSPIYSRNDGFSDRLDLTSISEAKWRNESIKASGNAIVPQVVHQIFKAIQEYDSRTNKI